MQPGQRGLRRGLLQGAWDAVWSTITGLAGLAKLPFDLVFGLVRDLITGTLVGKAKELWDVASQLNPGALLEGAGTLLGLALTDFAAKWNDPDLIKKWNFRGFVVGEAVAQVLLTVFSGGELLAVRALSRVGKLADLIEHLGVMGQLKGAAGALKGGAADAVRGALRGLAAAHAWAATALKIPAEVLVDLSEDAINRLRTLPPWLQERLSQLNVPGLRRALGCASPCMVDIKAVKAYLTEITNQGEIGARLLTTNEKLVEALNLPEWADKTRLLTKLNDHSEILEVIKRAHLTDKDFAKLKDFIGSGRTSMGKRDTYDLFTQYLDALIPAKIGPNIQAFYEFTADLNDYTTRSLKGAMFENFARLYIFPNSAGRAFIRMGGRKFVNSDLFDVAEKAVWDCKNQKSSLSESDIVKYVGVIGKTTDEGQVVESVNFLFPTQSIAELNRDNIIPKGFRVWYLIQKGAEPSLVRLL